MSIVEVTLRRLLAALVSSVTLLGCCCGARAQSTVWDSTISNSHWYVPVPQLLAYASSASSFAKPIPIGDQTLWALGASTNGAFNGLSSAQLAIGPVLTTSNSTIQGFVTTSGQITMIFTPVGGGATTIGLGQMQSINGVTSMEMQMITGTSLLVTHWAYMTPYNPALFTPPSAQVVFSNSSPQWVWTAGTPWRIVSPALFGTGGAGRFIVTNYQSGYFWGRGVGPNGSPVANFTLLGSITPQGKVLFNTLSQGTLTSLYGDITGNPSAAQMLTSEYNSLGMPTGGLAYMQLIRPYTDAVIALNNPSALGAAQALYRIAGSSSGLDGAMAPAINALSNLSGPALSNAISQTLPVLAGAATQATYNTQRAFQRVVDTRLDDVRGGLIEDAGVERNVWLKPFAGMLRQSGLDGVPGYRASGGGVAGGVDTALSPNLLLGGVFAYSRNSISGSDDAVPNTLEVDAYRGGVYGAYVLAPDIVANFQLDAGLNRNAESRSIAFMNSLASASYNSTTTHAGLSVKKVVPVGPRMVVVPSVGLDFARVRAEAYSETGADGLNLNVDSQTYRELTMSAGAKGIYRVANDVHLTAKAGMSYNTLGRQTEITASYAGGGDSFVTYGLNVSPWLYSFGAGLVGIRKDVLDLGVHYDLQASPTGYLNQAASVRLRMNM